MIMINSIASGNQCVASDTVWLHYRSTFESLY